MEEKLYIIIVDESIQSFSRQNGPHSMEDWVILLNQKLGHMSKTTKVVDWFGSNGNFVLYTKLLNIQEVTKLFQKSTGHTAVAITLSKTYLFINEIHSIQVRRLDDNVLWREGIGFQLQGVKRYFDDFQVESGLVRCIEPGVAGIMAPIPHNSLTRKRRSPPIWKKIKRKLSNRLDGEWTAKSLETLDGVFRRSLSNFSYK